MLNLYISFKMYINQFCVWFCSFSTGQHKISNLNSVATILATSVMLYKFYCIKTYLHQLTEFCVWTEEKPLCVVNWCKASYVIKLTEARVFAALTLREVGGWVAEDILNN